MPEKNWPSWSRGAEKGRTSLRIMALDAVIDELPPDADVEANRLMCMALLAAVALIVALVDLAGHRAVLLALVGLPRYLGPRTILQATRLRVPETAPSSEADCHAHLGCTSGSPPGVPGGGMTLR
jgi:hypothetical protein